MHFTCDEYHPSSLLRGFQIFLFVLIIIGIGLLATQKLWVPSFVAYLMRNDSVTEIPMFTVSPLSPLPVTIQGELFVLIDGIAEKQVTPESATKSTVTILDEPTYGDLDADGDADAAILLEHNPGGSGTFYYAVLAINTEDVYRTTETMFLGDRIAPQTIDIIDGRAVFNIVERRADEPMSAQPSLGKSIWIHYNKNTNEIGEWVKDFEGESNVPL